MFRRTKISRGGTKFRNALSRQIVLMLMRLSRMIKLQFQGTLNVNVNYGVIKLLQLQVNDLHNKFFVSTVFPSA